MHVKLRDFIRFEMKRQFLSWQCVDCLFGQKSLLGHHLKVKPAMIVDLAEIRAILEKVFIGGRPRGNSVACFKLDKLWRRGVKNITCPPSFKRWDRLAHHMHERSQPHAVEWSCMRWTFKSLTDQSQSGHPFGNVAALIDDDEGLSLVDKFNYMSSCLSGEATRAVPRPGSSWQLRITPQQLAYWKSALRTKS